MTTFTMKNTKAQMLAEIHRLEAVCASYRAASEPAPSRSARSPRPTPEDVEARRRKMETLKRAAITFKCAARMRDGQVELFSKRRRCWVPVPGGTEL